jgi:hypothetical protein
LIYVTIDHTTAGVDSGNTVCSQALPCLTISHVLEIASGSVLINILECFYPSNPLSFEADISLIISATVSENSTASLAWNSSYSGTASLFTMTSGNLTLRYITLWHNSSSKGPIVTCSSEDGSVRLIVFIVIYYLFIIIVVYIIGFNNIYYLL